MGLAKAEMMRKQELRYNSPGDKYVCFNCVGNVSIRKYIKANANYLTCSYCGRKARKHFISFHIDDVIEFILDGIYTEWDDPANGVGYDHEWVGAKVIDGYDLIYDELWDDLDIENDELMADLARSVAMYDWCHRNPYSLRDCEETFFDWANFCELVKHKSRYVFYSGAIAETDIYGGVKRPYDILERLGEIVKELHLIRKIKRDRLIYRVRTRKPGEVLDCVEKLGPPSPEQAINANRMSSAGIVMFYGAFGEQTAIDETCNSSPASITVAQFKTLQIIKALDLSAIPDVPSLFDPEKRHLRDSVIFLRNFTKDITQTIERDGKEHIEYVPTQIVTEYFKFVFRDASNKPIQGIIYPSSKNKSGIACVLFFEKEDCTQDNYTDDKSGKTLSLISSAIVSKEV